MSEHASLGTAQDCETSKPQERGFVHAGFWVAMVLFVVVPKLMGADTTDLTRDPTALGGQPFYYGMLSNLGVLGWCVSAAVCFFAAAFLRASAPGSLARSFLVWSGTLSACVMVDDLFLVHDAVGPHHLGIPEEAFYLFYAIFLGAYLLRFRSFLLSRTPYQVLATAFALLAISVLMDMDLLPGGTDVEDVAKFLGIGAFVHYYVWTAGRLQSSPAA